MEGFKAFSYTLFLHILERTLQHILLWGPKFLAVLLNLCLPLCVYAEATVWRVNLTGKKQPIVSAAHHKDRELVLFYLGFFGWAGGVGRGLIRFNPESKYVVVCSCQGFKSLRWRDDRLLLQVWRDVSNLGSVFFVALFLSDQVISQFPLLTMTFLGRCEKRDSIITWSTRGIDCEWWTKKTNGSLTNVPIFSWQHKVFLEKNDPCGSWYLALVKVCVCEGFSLRFLVQTLDMGLRVKTCLLWGGMEIACGSVYHSCG